MGSTLNRDGLNKTLLLPLRYAAAGCALPAMGVLTILDSVCDFCLPFLYRILATVTLRWHADIYWDSQPFRAPLSALLPSWFARCCSWLVWC